MQIYFVPLINYYFVIPDYLFKNLINYLFIILNACYFQTKLILS